jgi:hypothetical protein
MAFASVRLNLGGLLDIHFGLYLDNWPYLVFSNPAPLSSNSGISFCSFRIAGGCKEHGISKLGLAFDVLGDSCCEQLDLQPYIRFQTTCSQWCDSDF